MNLIDVYYGDRAKTYVDRVISFLISLDLEKQFHEEVSQWENEMSVVCNELDDVSHLYELYAEKEIDLADEYTRFSDGIYWSALAGFVHLWERDVKDLCISILKSNTVYDSNGKELTERDVHGYSFSKLKKYLSLLNVPESTFDEIELLHLAINVFKHGQGESAEKLLNKDKNLYRKLAWAYDLTTDFGLIGEYERISTNDLKRFGEALKTFWKKVSETISF